MTPNSNYASQSYLIRRALTISVSSNKTRSSTATVLTTLDNAPRQLLNVFTPSNNVINGSIVTTRVANTSKSDAVDVFTYDNESVTMDLVLPDVDPSTSTRHWVNVKVGSESEPVLSTSGLSLLSALSCDVTSLRLRCMDGGDYDLPLDANGSCTKTVTYLGNTYTVTVQLGGCSVLVRQGGKDFLVTGSGILDYNPSSYSFTTSGVTHFDVRRFKRNSSSGDINMYGTASQVVIYPGFSAVTVPLLYSSTMADEVIVPSTSQEIVLSQASLLALGEAMSNSNSVSAAVSILLADTTIHPTARVLSAINYLNGVAGVSVTGGMVNSFGASYLGSSAFNVSNHEGYMHDGPAKDVPAKKENPPVVKYYKGATDYHQKDKI
jgi:hypothetical protein